MYEDGLASLAQCPARAPHLRGAESGALRHPVLSALCLFITMLAVAQNPAVPAPEPPGAEDARRAFAMARRLSEADGGALWGRPLYGPMLIADPMSRTVFANAPDRQKTLRRIADDLWFGTLPDDVAAGNTFVRLGGTPWAMVQGPLQVRGGADPWLGTLLMHESFHRLQVDLKIPHTAANCGHVDELPGRVWLRVEWRALADALAAEAPLESPALVDALRMRAYRHNLVETAPENERLVENNEGLAEYTGLRLGGFDPQEQRERTIRMLRGAETGETLTRFFAYVAGPAYGLLLDLTEEDWRRGAGRQTDMAELLRRRAKLKVSRLKDDREARTLAEKYGLAEIEREEQARWERRLERYRAFQRRYLDGALLRIPLVGGMRGSFDPLRVEAFSDVGTVYEVTRLDGQWGTLNVTGGVLMTEIDAQRRRWLIVPAPDDPAARPLAGDGWTLDLSREWMLRALDRPGDFELVSVRR